MPTSEIMAYLFGAFVSLYLALQDKKINSTRTWRFWLFLSIFLFGFFFGLYNILDKYSDWKNDKKDIIDSNTSTSEKVKEEMRKAFDSGRQAILDSIQKGNEKLYAQGDSNVEEILKQRNPNIEYNAILTLVAPENGSGITNPSIEKIENTDSLKCSISIKNIGNDVAKEIVDHIIIVNYDRFDKPSFFTHKKTQIFNTSVLLAPGKDFATISFALFIQGGGTFTTNLKSFIYLKIDYKNFKGKVMQPFRTIFSLQKEGIYLVEGKEYNKVEPDLKKFGYY